MRHPLPLSVSTSDPVASRIQRIADARRAVRALYVFFSSHNHASTFATLPGRSTSFMSISYYLSSRSATPSVSSDLTAVTFFVSTGIGGEL